MFTYYLSTFLSLLFVCLFVPGFRSATMVPWMGARARNPRHYQSTSGQEVSRPVSCGEPGVHRWAPSREGQVQDCPRTTGEDKHVSPRNKHEIKPMSSMWDSMLTTFSLTWTSRWNFCKQIMTNYKQHTVHTQPEEVLSWAWCREAEKQDSGYKSDRGTKLMSSLSDSRLKPFSVTLTKKSSLTQTQI